jgi:superoxide dismutase, Cu-Zn family
LHDDLIFITTAAGELIPHWPVLDHGEAVSTGKITKMKPYIYSIVFGTTLACAVGCATNDSSAERDTARPSEAKGRPQAVAVLAPAPNGKVKGQVTFLQQADGVRVTANIEGLTPGKHGFHIHEKGDCSPPDFTSAGGHFNPGQMKHGSPTDTEHHVGDFGNIEANEQGVARFERVFQWLTFTGTNSILNKAVIIHEKADDLTTQPTGNAGGRLACGLIQMTP